MSWGLAMDAKIRKGRAGRGLLRTFWRRDAIKREGAGGGGVGGEEEDVGFNAGTL